MADGFVNVPELGAGVRIDNSTLTIGGERVYRQRVETYPAGSFGDLTADAWGVPKVSLPYSVFHGLFTFDVPKSQWFIFHGTTQVYTSPNVASVDSAGMVQADGTNADVTLQSRSSPRYQPNRGHLYSTALWCPSKTAAGTRDFGLFTVENGVFFRLKSDGLLYAVLRSGGVETKEEVIDTSGVTGFDVEKGNVFDIQYQWRGVGNYKFFINLVEVHVFENLGTLTALSMEDPALPASYRVTRTAGSVALYIGCVDISSENGSDDTLQYTSSYASDTINGTDIPVQVIYNPLQINSQTNTRMVEFARVSVLCDKRAVFKVWTTRDPAAITGATFAAIGNGSFVQTDSPDTVTGAVKATSVTASGLKLVTVIPVQPNVSQSVTNPNKERITFNLVRGDYFVVTVTTTIGLCDCVIEWGEAI